ncbi:MAG: glycosyltransferase family 2 protein [Roseimicrobium sp.]
MIARSIETPPALPKLCVVVPCYNEEESIPVLVEKLVPVLDEETHGAWCILFVDDGSRDATARIIWELHAKDPRYQGVRLSRNFGHQPAVWTGLSHARGECIGVIDCDLQDPPDVLMQLYRKVALEGYDVCSGVRGKREEAPWWLCIAYKVFYRTMKWAAEHDYTLDSGDFCVINARAHRVLKRLGEAAPVHRGLRSWVGFRQGTVTYLRPPRLHGQSKYNLARLFVLAVSNMVNFSTAPLRLATGAGLCMALMTLLAAVLFSVNRFVPSFKPLDYDINANAGTTTIVLYISFIASALFFCLGIIGEYLAVIVKEVKRRPVAIIAEATDLDAALP